MSSGLHAAGSAAANVVPLRSRLAAALRSRTAPWAALALLVIGTGALLYHETRGTTLWFDDWVWLLQRRTNTLGSFLDTHNGHLSLIPVAIYKLLWATAGIRSDVPYRLLVIVSHLATCVMLFAYARRRVGAVLALLVAGVLLLFGPGWENLLWGFQITWNLSLAAGLGALLALDRHDRAADLIACVLLAASLASSGIGVPIVLGVAVELALARRRPRDTWVVAVPLLLYGLWAIGYQHTSLQRHAIVAAPDFIYTAASATLSALAGLGGSTGQDGPGTLMTWGPVLLVAALAATGWRLVRLGRVDPRVGALATMALSFWLLTALNRSFITTPFASRYLYVGAVFVLLLGIELMRGVVLNRWAMTVVGLAAVAAIVSNVGALRDAARLLRANGQTTTADLGALEIGRPVMPAGYIAQQIPGYPYVILPAAGYFAAERSVGTPAASPAQIAADPATVRAAVDTELIHIHRLALVAAGTEPALGRPPAADGVGFGSSRTRGACASFGADRFLPAGATPGFAVTVPASGLALETRGAPAVVGVRRFGDAFQTLGTLTPGARATLVIGADRSPLPWHVQLLSAGLASACGLR